MAKLRLGRTRTASTITGGTLWNLSYSPNASLRTALLKLLSALDIVLDTRGFGHPMRWDALSDMKGLTELRISVLARPWEGGIGQLPPKSDGPKRDWIACTSVFGVFAQILKYLAEGVKIVCIEDDVFSCPELQSRRQFNILSVKAANLRSIVERLRGLQRKSS